MMNLMRKCDEHRIIAVQVKIGKEEEAPPKT
jgi:hypothetical protein